MVRRNAQIFLLGVAHRALRELPLQGRSLGQYLLDDCRHAIAHIRRKPGRRALKFDDEEENGRLWRSARVTEVLARHYIASALGVTERLHLVRPRRGGFPVYLDEGPFSRAGTRRSASPTHAQSHALHPLAHRPLAMQGSVWATFNGCRHFGCHFACGPR